MPATYSRRRMARLDYRVAVEVRGASSLHVGVSRNISHGGLFVEMAPPLAVGEPVKVRFRLGDANPIDVEADGRVQWANREGAGMIFTRGLRAREAWALNRLMAQPQRPR